MDLNIKQCHDCLEIWNFEDEQGGCIIRCYPDGRIELFEVPQYGGAERYSGNYPTICDALENIEITVSLSAIRNWRIRNNVER